MAMGLAISYFSFMQHVAREIPQVRRIARLGILLLHFTFMNILFCSLTFLIQPHVSEPHPTTFHDVNVGLSMMFVILVPMIMLGIGYHFYKTYNSDILEHYYTLRECAHYWMIISQAFIFTFGINKALISLYLLGL